MGDSKYDGLLVLPEQHGQFMGCDREIERLFIAKIIWHRISR